jgi:hypothetical protein
MQKLSGRGFRKPPPGRGRSATSPRLASDRLGEGVAEATTGRWLATGRPLSVQPRPVEELKPHTSPTDCAPHCVAVLIHRQTVLLGRRPARAGTAEPSFARLTTTSRGSSATGTLAALVCRAVANRRFATSRKSPIFEAFRRCAREDTRPLVHAPDWKLHRAKADD